MTNEKIFSIENKIESVEKIKSNLNFPFVSVYSSELGGKENISILICVSFDAKENWINGYLENSKYLRFHLHNDGRLEKFSGDKEIKFRKCKVKNLNDAVIKINNLKGV